MERILRSHQPAFGKRSKNMERILRSHQPAFGKRSKNMERILRTSISFSFYTYCGGIKTERLTPDSAV